MILDICRHLNALTSERAEASAANLLKLVETVERKMEIEAKMEELVVKTHAKMREVEEMMNTGYFGRERDAQRAQQGEGSVKA